MTGIHFNSPLSNDVIQGPKQPLGPTADRAPATSPQDNDEAKAVAPTSWMERLESLPEIRPEEVARGQKLLADPSYPDAVVTQRIAERLLDEPLS